MLEKTEISKFESTKEINVSNSLIHQIIGQDEAVKTIKKAAKRLRRKKTRQLSIINTLHKTV